ncbi:MAG: mannose-6-phosphate isomerase, class I, partial [Bifidobacteriaceae bacterium]|nr:mannose-6-phosphate isomerase, class I [Bifidobacteriaceae bacterium]
NLDANERSTGLLVIRPAARDYAWGSPSAIPGLFGWRPTGHPVAEVWYGAHPLAPATVAGGDLDGWTLDRVIGADPVWNIGPLAAAGEDADRLPYLLKVLGVAGPLSLQVHPSKSQAETGFAREDAAHVSLAAPSRNYKDANHKPELAMAISPFEALAGFRPLADILGLLEPLDCELARAIAHAVTGGIGRALAGLLTGELGDEAAVEALADHCRRLARTSADAAYGVAARLADHYPGDPGVAVSLLLAHHRLAPGELLFVPPGCVHSYLGGMIVEVMASSDNVLRAGLTRKHIDVGELLACVDPAAEAGAGPLNIAVDGGCRTIRPPVPDFCLTDLAFDGRVPLPGAGPRIVLVLSGRAAVHADGEDAGLGPGGAVFIPDGDGAASVSGAGHAVIVHL